MSQSAQRAKDRTEQAGITGGRSAWLRRAALLTSLVGVAVVAGSTSAAVGAPAYGPPKAGPELSVMAFTQSDLRGGAVQRQGYVKPTDGLVAEYDREFKALSVRLGTKRLLGIENDVLLERTADAAAFGLAALELGVALAGDEIGKELAKGAGVKAQYVKVGDARPLGAGDQSVGALIRIGTQAGEIRFVIAGVRVGRVTSMFYFIGVPRAKVGLPEARQLARVAARRTRAGLAPANKTLPALAGVAQEGQALDVTAGTWLNAPRLAYQWQRCDAAGACAPIQGATLPRYLATPADVGSSLQVLVTGRNAYGSFTAASVQTAPVSAAGAPASTAPPTVAGTAANGQTLTAAPGAWNGNPTAFAFQWRRCDAGGTGCSDVAGATQATYVVTGSDAGFRLRVGVVATNAVGSGTAVSAPTALVT